jgi:glycosyltransferase involved in cell wall biosynthesis
MITIIYPYKNKELERLHKSLQSLERQENQDFEILIVDYGSDLKNRDFNKKELRIYKKVKYFYSYHIYQPWSRPRAINIGVKLSTSDYIFTADIDMIFRNDFIQLLHDLKHPKKSYFFKVGYLSEQESKKEKKFENYKPMHYSKVSAQGISLFPKKELCNINGLDEYIHFWGADNDVHNRLVNNGLFSFFYDSDILVLHQWHKIYANEEKKVLTKKLQLPYISQINQKLQEINLDNKIVSTNLEGVWGIPIIKEEYQLLENASITIFLGAKEAEVLHFLYVMLPRFKNGVLNITFIEKK